MDYFLTTRASVVSEARAKLRGMMLGQCTDNDLIHPWALHMAPMPVYLSPHADLLVPFLKQQALELQRFCSDTLLEYAEFQNKKIEVDKDCLRKVLDNDIEQYKKCAGALFDARRRVRQEVEMQLVKQHKELGTQQVPDKELASKCRGVVPRKYSYADAVRQNTGDNNQGQGNPTGRSRSRSRSTNRNSGRGRSQSRQRAKQDFRPPQAPNRGRDQQPRRDNQRRDTNAGATNYNRRDANSGANNQYGARPKTNTRSFNPRPSGSGLEHNRARPEWALSDRNPEPLDWHEAPPAPVAPRPDFEKLRGIDNKFFTPDLVRRIAEAYDGLNKY